METAGYHVDSAEVTKRYIYEKESFQKKLYEMGVDELVVKPVMDSLADRFIYGESEIGQRYRAENNSSKRSVNAPSNR